jgi:hypothetical protein
MTQPGLAGKLVLDSLNHNISKLLVVKHLPVVQCILIPMLGRVPASRGSGMQVVSRMYGSVPVRNLHNTQSCQALALHGTF